MSHTHYYQEDTDEGLKIAALLNQLIESPGALSKKEWDYLNTLPIGTLMREAGISRKEAVHVFNQIDRIEADVSRIGRFEHLTDAFMMWLVGGSFVLAGVLLALPLSVFVYLFTFIIIDYQHIIIDDRPYPSGKKCLF